MATERKTSYLPSNSTAARNSLRAFSFISFFNFSSSFSPSVLGGAMEDCEILVKVCQCPARGETFVKVCQCPARGEIFVKVCQCPARGEILVKVCQCPARGEIFVKVSQCPAPREN